MSQNKLIEVGSKANVILRFRNETEICGKTYLPHEPYILFKNANITIDYSNEDKTGTAARTVVANSGINPRTISIESVNLTKKLIGLLTEISSDVENFGFTQFQTSSASEENNEKVIYLNKDLLENSEDKIFVYEEETFELVEDITYDSSDNKISSINFDLSKTYLIVFSSEIEGTRFKLNKPEVPYLSMEIQGIGNVNKQTKNIILYFEKVSLTSVIAFNFIYEGVINVPLDFHIIENKNNFMWVEE